ncbi:Protein SODIUM POTASSIUM ROOT DEFECTIVE 3 [Linum perenne]
MKKMEIFCKSPSSTAICSSLDHRSMVRHHYSSTPSTPKTPIFTPCSSNDLLPFHPSDNLRRRSTTVALADLYRKSSASDNPKQSTPRRRSAADIADLLRLRHRHSRSGSSAHLDCPLALNSSSSVRSHDQVVELRVSIHCKGCEGKVRKHISKMEGVTSFSIDVATKKVTVKGNVTPMGVLASISKVKSAQLWSAEFLPPRPPSAAAAATPRWSN